MLLHAFPSMLVKFTSWISRKLGGLNCFIEYLHRKLLTANFLSYDIEIVKKKSAFIVFAY
jgi:hypothetical protein